MSSLYDTSVVPAKQLLTALSNILRKGEEHANGANYLTSTIHEDMKPLSFQISVALSLVEKMVARLTVSPVPEAETPSSFAEAYALIEKSLKTLDSADKTTINNNAEKTAEIGMGPGVNVPMRLDAYASAYSIPNLYFHVMTAYTILRKEGVPIGKMDYLGPFMGPYIPQKQ